MPSPIDLGAFPNPFQALLALRQSVAQEPDSTVLRHGLMQLLIQMERFSEAVPHGQYLLNADPGDAEVCFHLAWALIGAGEMDSALRLIQGHPQESQWCEVLGRIMGDAGRWKEARILFSKKLELKPRDPDTYSNLITTNLQLDQFEKAEALAQAALMCFSGEDATRFRFAFHLGAIHMLHGRFDLGLPLMEARFGVSTFQQVPAIPIPVWAGEPLQGRTLLVRWEQGFGDVFMGVRFATILARMGAEVLVETNPGASSVLSTCKGVNKAVEGEISLPLDSLQIPVMSLLNVLGVRAGTIPAEVPYLHVPEVIPNREVLERLLPPKPSSRRLGLVWAGNPKHPRDKERSIPVEVMERLAEVPGVEWVSLQKGEVPRPSIPMLDLAPFIHDFADTAFALDRLDGLITVDTSVAHLAGAMGRPTWLLLAHLPDWRWMLERTDTPWYPTVRLWRQPVPGDWVSVLQDVTEALMKPK